MSTSGARFDWNNEGVHARLVGLWAGGDSGEAIARILNKEFGATLTRNAVLSKAMRLNLVRNVPSPPKVIKPLPVPPAVVPAQVVAAPASRPVPACEAVNGYALEDVPLYGCKWPVTGHHVGAHEHRFCGARARTGRPYCTEHHARAYVAAPKPTGRPAAKPKSEGRPGPNW